MFFRKKVNVDLEFPEKITINEKLYKIEVVFLKKRSSSVNIKNNILNFRMSSFLNSVQAQKHFKDLLVKIKKKIEKSVNLSKEKTIEEVLEIGYFEFSSEKYYFERVKSRGVKLIENVFYVNCHMKASLVEKYVINLLIKKYSSRLKNYVRALNFETYNFSMKDLELKNLNSKWGHCTHDNSIMLNLKLLNAKKEVLDYVIYHELCHIKHKNHSKSFWSEVSRFCFNYKNYRKLLKDNPPVLFK